MQNTSYTIWGNNQLLAKGNEELLKRESVEMSSKFRGLTPI